MQIIIKIQIIYNIKTQKKEIKTFSPNNNKKNDNKNNKIVVSRKKPKKDENKDKANEENKNIKKR